MPKEKSINIDSMLIAIGKIIKEQRDYLGLTVSELSKKSGVSVGVISDLENNRGRVPSLANFILLAKALELPDEMFANLLEDKVKIKTPVDKEENLRKALSYYGLNKTNVDMLMVQIEAIHKNQCSDSLNRKVLFNNSNKNKSI